MVWCVRLENGQSEHRLGLLVCGTRAYLDVGGMLLLQVQESSEAACEAGEVHLLMCGTNEL